MRESVNDVNDIRAHDPRGLSRMMAWSFAVHLAVVAAALLVPRAWLVTNKPTARTMFIQLGGSVGPATSGATPAGARPVEKVAPEPKRAEPVPPAAAKPDVMSIPYKPAKPQPRPDQIAKPPSPVTLPPTTGRQITPGTSRAETGARGQDTGISIGGGGTGGADSLTDFCCKGYLADIVNIIRSRWRPELEREHGVVVMKFTIQRDGQVTDVSVEQHSTFLLERASNLPLLGLRLPRLPNEYKESSLTIHLNFEYK